MRRLLLLSVALLVLASVPTVRSQDNDKDDVYEQRLKNAFLNTDSESLTKFLSTRAKGAADGAGL